MQSTKRIILASLVLVIACQEGTKAQGPLSWAPSIDVARQVAARQNQLVLVHFWSPSCPPCLRLERSVFNDPQVAASISRDYVPVKINVQNSPTTARQYSIQQLPTDIVLSSNGQILFRGISPATSAEFVAHYQQVANSQRSKTGTLISQAPGQNPTSHQNVSFNPSGKLAHAQGTYSPPGPASQPTHSFAPAVSSDSTAPTWQNSTGTVHGDAPNNHRSPTSPDPSGPPTNPENSTHTLSGPSQYAGIPQQESAADSTPSNTATAASAASVSPPVLHAPAGNPPTGIDGYCPVTLSEQSRWQLGDIRWGAVHRGRTYLFASPDSQQRFLANPDFYAPMLSGNDPVEYIDRGNLVGGTRRHGIFYRQQVYLFTSEETLNHFWKSPERYHGAAYQALRQADALYQARKTSNRSNSLTP